jgi:iron(II)-dependent oxidoreductase
MFQIFDSMTRARWWIAGFSLVDFCLGVWNGSLWLVFGGAAGLCVVGWWLNQNRLSHARRRAESLQSQVDAAVDSTPEHQPPADTSALVEQMLIDGRYALLLRPQLAPNLSHEQLRRALEALETQTSFVVSGQLCIGLAGKESDDLNGDELEFDMVREVVQVDEFRLDRYAVSNREFHRFVLAGGYSQASLWDPQIWAAVVDFVDRTGCPGPRFWTHGKYAPGEHDLPVIGVSYYEAAAYARWVGKRLPTDPEWEKAGAWPVALSETLLLQRRYPWGDAMERERANLWGGPGHLVPVKAHEEGASGGGVHQLIGNVWEWTSGDFSAGPYHRRGIVLGTPMKSIRGGAYDTYFDNQATCQYQSGENPVNRKHNVGFRCAVSICDLAAPARRLRPVEAQHTREEQLA